MKWGRVLLKSIVVACAIGLIAYGAYGVFKSYQTAQITSSIPTEVVSKSYDNPGMTDISEACDEYSVGSSLPRYIYIQAIRSSGCIHRVGVDQNNLIATPVNVGLAGWYVSSAKPGAPGVSVIVGFIQSNDTPGIFANLNTLKAGDIVMVQLGNKSKLYFTVVDGATYKGAEYIAHLTDPLSTTPRQLTLVGVNTSTTPTTYTLVRASLSQQ